MKEIAVFIFRRDMRMKDNTAFIKCIDYCKKNDLTLLPMFNITPVQIIEKNNEYFSHRSVQFLDDSLADLQSQLKNKYKAKLHLIFGEIDDILHDISKKYKINCVFYNKDLTPFARKRDEDLNNLCEANDIETFGFEDYTVYPVNSITSGSGGYYKVFTPFYNKAKEIKINKPVNEPNVNINIVSDSFKNIKKDLKEFYDATNNLIFKGGRIEGLKRLKLITEKKYDDYKDERDYPALQATTNLSAYIKYGCVSIREVADTLVTTYNKNNEILRQIIFRDFYYNCVYNHPEMLDKQINKRSYNKDFDSKFDGFPWSNNKEMLEKWVSGTTGYPLVDAGMRELNNSGYCHNRSRLVTSSFLIKHLNIDWRIGEKIYSKLLCDYDVINNRNGWTAQTSGPSALAYFRIINPYMQAKKYDKDCVYIKKWIPELRDIPSKDILNWETKYKNYPNCTYPKACVDHKTERENVLKRFKEHLK